MPVARYLFRRSANRLSGLFAAILILALTGFGVPTAAPVTAETTVSATPADSGDLVSGEDLRLFVSLNNATALTTASATSTVFVGSAPVTSRSTLADWFVGTGDAKLAPTEVGTAPFPAVASGQSDSIEVTIPATSLPWTTSGVYLISVSVASSTASLGSSTTAVALNVESTPVSVAIAVPLTVPASESSFLTSAQLSEYTAPGGILTRELGDVESTGVAVGIDPRILASIRVLGNTAPSTARDWMTELAELPNQTFPLAWADADLTAPLHAGATSILETKSLDYSIDPSHFPVTSSPSTPTPTPTAGPVQPLIPTTATLAEWNYTMPELAWPAENSVISSDLGTLGRAGLTGAILSSTNVKYPDKRGIAGASAKVGDDRVAVSDAVLSGYLRAAIQSTTRSTSAEALTALTTSLALMSVQSGSAPHPVLLTLGRNWADADTNFERSVSEIYARPWTTVTDLASLFTVSPTAVSIAAQTESSARIAQVSSLLESEQDIVTFAPVAADPDILISSTRLKLLSVLSNEWTAKTWTAASNSFLTQGDKVLNSVQVDPSTEVLILADQTSLPVSISNGLDQDVTVNLVVRSRTALVSIDRKSKSQTVTVDEGAQRRILIPIEALSNGKAEIVATLVSSTGIPIGHTVTIKVNVQAGWESVGTLVFSALVVALFAFGIIRSIRKRLKLAGKEETE